MTRAAPTIGCAGYEGDDVGDGVRCCASARWKLSSKAARGDRIPASPWLRAQRGRSPRDGSRPSIRREALAAFSKFAELRGVPAAVLWFRQGAIDLPQRSTDPVDGDDGRPGHNSVLKIPTNPVYAGAHAWSTGFEFARGRPARGAGHHTRSRALASLDHRAPRRLH
jgi:hypothetical protein